MASGGAPSMSPTSPVSSRHGVAPKRKRSTGLTTVESSPGSFVDENQCDADKKRQPGVKRACNECRQQKLRCDVIQDPFQSCTRCRRLKLECKIESNFKRVGKRSKHAEMEKEIERLRRSVARAKTQGFAAPDDDDDEHIMSTAHSTPYMHTRNPSLMGSDEAVSSLLHLKRGGAYAAAPQYAYDLDGVRLTEDDVNHLFNEYFAFYHPFLPFLSPHQAPDQYYQQHALLFWTIVAVAARRYSPPNAPDLLKNLSSPLTRFLWTTIGEVPSSYYVVKAMCLLGAWPLPTSTSTSDPTHILCGVMMKTATGIGLHRPNHIQDFSRVSVELDSEQLNDRVTTWAVCNIVAQNIGTGYGQPASTLYDWTLAARPGDDNALKLTPELEARLQIERFCDKVSKEMYSNASDPRGVAGDEHRAMLMRVYRRDYAELHASIMSQRLGPVVNIHLRAAALHMRLAGFFDSSTTPGYMDDLMGLWRAASSFLDEVLGLEKNKAAGSLKPRGTLLQYTTNYIQQMLVAAGFTILKLIRSFFAKTIDFQRGRTLFHSTVAAIRRTSVVHNDLQWRLAELMVQMWNGARLDTAHHAVNPQDDSPVNVDDSLQLKVRCRHSMSLVFDSVWRWREEYQAIGRGSLEGEQQQMPAPSLPPRSPGQNMRGRSGTARPDDANSAEAALKQPTNPDSANESSSSSSHLDSTLMASQGLTSGGLNSNGTLTPGGAGAVSTSSSAAPSVMGSLSYGETNYDFFDPQNWMLDGLLDFNYNAYAQPLEGA
ncbi:Fungal specific transcription factor domain [Geosmithia morbida]|uniref:Fungal specific transcription factor domain n=1 Tax=Geosmithia morbida TaxID=1094350 RepID=A0A9P4Z096_9HYPO|nr:Fungal specific transcription factor domain [Geosmithia morbida]KAF4125047.1 Fungal specific transcription factor domain [Geosmithia morbida]